MINVKPVLNVYKQGRSPHKNNAIHRIKPDYCLIIVLTVFMKNIVYNQYRMLLISLIESF